MDTILLGVRAGGLCSYRADPRLRGDPGLRASLVAFAGAVVARGDHRAVAVRVCAVVFGHVHVWAQNVVGALGLPSEGCCRGGGIGTAGTAAADGSAARPISAACWPILVLPPCGLGLIPINSNVQIFVLPDEATNETVGGWVQTVLTSRYLDR